MEEKKTEQIFRKKSIERISSPEKLDDFLKVSTPSLWLVMGAVVSLLIGFLVWASVEELETKINTVANIEKSKVQITLTGNDAEKIKEGMKVLIGTQETTIDYIQYDDLGRAIAICSLNIPDGNYKAEVIVERIHPISFLFR